MATHHDHHQGEALAGYPATLGFLDRFILPEGQSVDPTRWHHHVIRRRLSHTDHLRPHRLNWEALRRPRESPPPATDGEALTPRGLIGVRYFWLDGLFTAVSENLFLSFIPLYILAIGATTADVGIMTAVQNLAGAISLLPGALVVEAERRHKPFVVWTVGGFARGALLALACLLFLPVGPGVALLLFVALNGFRSFMANLGNPAWTALVADLVPHAIRSHYFTSRTVAMSVAAFLVAPLAGLVIRAGNGWAGLPLLGYQGAFLLAFLFGMVATVCFHAVPEPHPTPQALRQRHTGASLFEVARRTPGFVGLVVSAFVWNLALQLAAPFFSVYLVTHLGATASTVGVLAAVNTFSGLIGSRVFGRLHSQKGPLWVQQRTGLLIPILPLSWMFVTAPWQTGLVDAVGGLLWAGYNLANFTLLLELTPDEHRAQAVALYQAAVFGSAVVGPLLGGYLATQFSFPLIFGLSAAGRLIGIALFIWLAARPARRAGKGLD